MPDGSVLPHPALVISRDELQLDEDGMFYAVLISTKNYHPEYTIKIQDEWLNKPLVQVICHLSDILSLSNTEKGRAYGSSFFVNMSHTRKRQPTSKIDCPNKTNFKW